MVQLVLAFPRYLTWKRNIFHGFLLHRKVSHGKQKHWEGFGFKVTWKMTNIRLNEVSPWKFISNEELCNQIGQSIIKY